MKNKFKGQASEPLPEEEIVKVELNPTEIFLPSDREKEDSPIQL